MSSGTSGSLRRAVLAALGAIQHPASQQDVLAAGHVRDLEVSDSGEVRFAFHLQPQDPGSLVRQSREAVEAVDGVSDVKVDVQLPSSHGQGGDGGGSAPPPRGSRRPETRFRPSPDAPPRPPPPDPTRGGGKFGEGGRGEVDGGHESSGLHGFGGEAGGPPGR